jgi:hypothetical protein
MARKWLSGQRRSARPEEVLMVVLQPRQTDQDHFTDPQSRIMKHPTNAGFEQDDNVQIELAPV